jgi:NAD(P)-dependent dehydrogenase (short-subunit alcohol dehydrogenase family)
MRTVLIIRASKGIGLETVRLALKAGHSVRALSRSATAIRLDYPKLEKLDGDALDRDMIELALVGVDVGVSPAPELIFLRALRQDLSRGHSIPRVRTARENAGAPGVDGVSFGQIEERGLEAWLTGLREELVSKTYRPDAVRRAERTCFPPPRVSWSTRWRRARLGA